MKEQIRKKLQTQARSHFRQNNFELMKKTSWINIQVTIVNIRFKRIWMLILLFCGDTVGFVIWVVFVFVFCLFRSVPAACGSSQARGWIGAIAASLHHSHSNARIQAVSLTYTTAHSNTILNPLSEARDQTCVLMVTSRILNVLSHNGNSPIYFINSSKRMSVPTP